MKDANSPFMKGIDILKCDQCGADTFYVWQTGYTTFTKCCNCGYETSVHDG